VDVDEGKAGFDSIMIPAWFFIQDRKIFLGSVKKFSGNFLREIGKFLIFTKKIQH